MNKNILALAVAAAVATPMAAQADLKLSGVVQAEVGSVEVAGGDRVTYNDMGTGALGWDGGMNKISFDFDEKLDGGLTAFGRADWVFDTSGSTNSWGKRETYVGLKNAGAHFKVGRIQGIYKTTGGSIDPLHATGAQSRGMGGGRTGGGFGHGSYLNSVLEVGFKGGDFGLTAQYIADEGTKLDGSWLVGADYSTKTWGLWAGASSEDKTGAADALINAKVGGFAKFGGLTAALQYESAESGTYNERAITNLVSGDTATQMKNAYGSVDQGDYMMGSLAYGMGNVTLAGWLASYSSDNYSDGDAISWSVGAVYSLSKRTMLYGAYHQTDSDVTFGTKDDVFDWNAFALGVAHKF